jgi:glyoxylase-like metal-dependent hydrolase (beta-lactamase superfamily II)/rhodanese-related sulfurtransferase
MPASFTAEDLYGWIEQQQPHLYLDVRNETDFARFSVEGPHAIEMVNLPYFDFLEAPEETMANLDASRSIKVICAKEGSAKFIAEFLEEFGFDDVAWLEKGIIAWGNVIIAKELNTPGEYRLWQFNRPGKASCSYGLAYEEELMLFDVSKSIDFYADFAKQHGFNITHVFETHLQADYISGGPHLAKMAGATYHAHEGDFGGTNVKFTPVIDGATISFKAEGGPTVLCTHSPGHTPGSTTYVLDDRFMVSGDTVFIVSVGRPDLGKKVVEWANQLYETLKTRICILPDDLQVLPGHYTDWGSEANEAFQIVNDFGSVKAINESIYGIDNAEEFVTWIEHNMRPQPDEYNLIRRVNSLLDEVDDAQAEELDLGKNQCAASHE